MANLVKIDFVLRVARQHNLKYWRLWDASGELLESRESDSIEESASLQALQDAFDGVDGDFVTIRLSPNKLKRGGDQITNVYTYKVKCLSAGSSSSSSSQLEERTGQEMKGAPGMWQMLADLRVQIAEQKKDQEINDLKRQLKDKGKGGNSQLLQNYLAKLLLSESSQPAALQPIAGTEPAPVQNSQPVAERTAPGAQAKLVASLNRFKKLDADFITTLEKLCDYAEKNPGSIEQIKAML